MALKIFMDTTDPAATVSNNDVSVYAATGTQTVTLGQNLTGLSVDANVENLVFAGAVADYKVVQAGAKLKLYAADGTTLVATIAVQDDTDGTLLTFANGSAAVKNAGAVMTLGTQTVGATAAAITGATLTGPTYTVAPAATTIQEGLPLTFTVTASAAATTATNLTFTVVGDTLGVATAATAADFLINNGTVTIAADATTGTFTVTPKDDGVAEGLEAFKVQLLNSGNNVIATSATVTIPDGSALGQTFTLTAASDTVPGLLGGNGSSSTGANDDIYIANNLTLTANDRINDATGTNDTLKYSSSALANVSAFEMSGVENVQVTADGANPLTFDMSGATGVNQFTVLNSTGNTTFNQVTKLADLKLDNVTTGVGGVTTLDFQDAVVSGAADSINLLLANNSNATPVGTIFVGRTSDGATVTSMESIKVTTSGAAATVTTLNSNITTLGVAGDKALTITTPLATTLRTISAGTFTAALDVNLTGNVGTPLTITTGTGADVIDLQNDASARDVGVTATGNATISTGDGADMVYAGLGDDNINLGAGNDTLVLLANGLTVNDTIVGGAGSDTIRFAQADTISKSEAEKVSGVELFDVRGAGSSIVVTDNLLTTIDGSTAFTVSTTGATVGSNQVVDITNVRFSNTNLFVLNGHAGTSTVATGVNESVIANDATVNAKAVLNFGAGASDTLRVVDSATITTDDLANITGLEVINLETSQNTPQTWNIHLNNAFFRQASANNADATDGTAAVTAAAAVGASSLRITVDDEVPAGSVLNIYTDEITDAQAALLVNALNVQRTTNLTVNVNGTAAGIATAPVAGSLKFTTNADTLTTMTGTAGTDIFVADFLNEVNVADSIDGLGAANDVLQLNFAISNAAVSAMAQLSNPSIANVEVLTFNSNDNVAFTTDGCVPITTVNFGSGNDTIANNVEVGTYNFGNGTNIYLDTVAPAGVGGATIGAEVLTSGTGNDTFTFAADSATNGTQLDATDSVSAGTGVNTVNIIDGAFGGALYALPNVLTNVDAVNYTPGHDADGLVVDGTDVNVAQDGETDFQITDAGIANTAVIFNASTLTAGNANPYTAKVNVIGAGTGLAGDAADVIGGADADKLTIGGTNTGYVVQGNAGADTIAIVTANATGVRFQSPNDGGTTGANTGFDVITGFTSATDYLLFSTGGFLATNGAGTFAGAALTQSINAPIAFAAVNELLMTQAGTGLTDADLLNLDTIASRANTIGVTAAAAVGGIIVAQGATKSAIYLYVESNGTANNITGSTELKMIATVDTNALGNAAGDLKYV